MIPEYLVYLSFPISIYFSHFYIRDIIRGTTRPNLVTWFFWSLAPLVGVFLQLKEGAGLSIIPVFLAGFMPLVIFIIALFQKNRYWEITKFDIFCGVFSFIALVLWIVTKRADVALIFAILSDGFASVPTLIKSWKFPDTETALGYVPGILNNLLGLLVITTWTFSIYSFGIYFILLNLTLIIFITRKRIFKIS